MAILTIGRVGLDPVILIDPEGVRGQAAPGSQGLSFHGSAIGANLAETKVLRDELIAQTALPGPIIPITWDGDSNVDGFYRLASAGFDIASLNDKGFVIFDVAVDRVGAPGDMIFGSKLVGTVLANTHGVTEAESEPFHAPPRGFFGYDPGSTVPSVLTRTGSGGGIIVFRDVDFTVDPWWSILPAGFYDGGASVDVGTYERAGLTAPNLPAAWRLSNELVRVTPNGTGGRIDVQHHDGTQWETAKTWRIQSGGSDVGEWDALRILRNNPAEVAVRLTRDVTNGGQIILDLSLRRGSRFVTGYLTRHASATLKVVRATTEAGADVTPTGASNAVGVRASVNDGDGNRYIVGSAGSFTSDLTTGGLSKTSTTTLDFFVGSAIGGGGAVSGDTAAALCLQYLGHLTEHVFGAPR